MRYLLAILLPPISLMMCDRYMLAIFMLLLMLTLIGWLPAAIVALLVAMDYERNKRGAV